jgi:hypothetical protein
MSITIIFLVVDVVLLLLMNVRGVTFLSWSDSNGAPNRRSEVRDGHNAIK